MQIKMKIEKTLTNRTDFADKIITAENVQRSGEIIAMVALRTAMRFQAAGLESLYDGLIKDLNRINRLNNVNEQFTDGYDVAQTAMCYLCGFINKKFGDIAETDKHGNAVSISEACFKEVSRYIRNKRAYSYRSVCIDEIRELLTATEFEFDEQKLEDFTAVNSTIDKMRLSDKEKLTLSYRMSGSTITETAKILSSNKKTIWSRMNQIKKKYIEKILTPSDTQAQYI